MLMQHKMHFGGPPMPEFPHPHVAINFVRHRERDLRLSVLSLIIDATDGPAPANHSRAENIGSALKRGVNVCQRQFVNEVLGPLVTEFIRNLGGEADHLGLDESSRAVEVVVADIEADLVECGERIAVEYRHLSSLNPSVQA
jgi:hypothetical protein